MAPQSLPDNANLKQLEKRAKSLQRLVLAGDPGAVDVAKKFHPRLGSALSDSLEFAGFTLTYPAAPVSRPHPVCVRFTSSFWGVRGSVGSGGSFARGRPCLLRPSTLGLAPRPATRC